MRHRRYLNRHRLGIADAGGVDVYNVKCFRGWHEAADTGVKVRTESKYRRIQVLVVIPPEIPEFTGRRDIKRVFVELAIRTVNTNRTVWLPVIYQIG